MKLRTRLLSLALVLGLILGLCPGALAAGSYADVPEDNWAYPYIEDMTEQGWMEGVDVHRFSPNGTMTRAMFVTVLARMSGQALYPEEPSVFPDVPAGRYFTGAVNWAAEKQIVTGYPDGTFGTDDPVTREQAATFLVRYGEVMGVTWQMRQETIAFTDRDAMHAYAKEAVELCSRVGILAGYPDGSFRPLRAITRAEAAKVLSVFLDVTGLATPEPTAPTGPDPTVPEPTEPEPTAPPPTEPEPTEPEPTEPGKRVKIAFVGENGYVKYRGEKVTEIEVSTSEPYVEFGIYGQWEDGFELDTATASSGKLSRAGNVFLLSDFDEDVTVNYTVRYRTVYVDFVISPNYQNLYVDTPQAVTWGQPAVMPAVSRTGYHVDAWYLDPEYTAAYDFATPVRDHLTLYGQWQINTYTVTYIVDGAVYYSTQVEYNRYVTNPKNPEKDGYVFNGWFLDEACTQPFQRSSTQIRQDTTLYAGWVEAKLEYVYLNGQAGHDDNSGMTPSDAVATFARAKELLAGAAHKEIRITGMVTVHDTQVWDLSEYPDAKVLRDESYASSYLFWVSATGNLTLQNVTIDGGCRYWANEAGEDFVSYMVFNCTDGYLTLNEGAELCHTVTKSTSSSAVGYLNGAHLTINEGARIHDNVGGKAGAFGCTSSGSSVIVMNGGEIYHNTATGKATAIGSSTPAGAFLLMGNSKTGSTVMTMNGGKIYGNRVENPDTTVGSGAIYMNDRANMIMNGGEIYDNTGVCAGAIMSKGVAESATSQVNRVALLGGTISNNTITGSYGGDIAVCNYTDLILGREDVLHGSIWLQNGKNRLPVKLSYALTKPLQLRCEAIVYEDVLLEGADYALTETDLAQIQLSEEMDSHYQLTLDTEHNQIYIGPTQVVGARIYLSGTGDDANDGLTRDTAVATFARAKELLTANQSEIGDNVITVVAGTATGTPTVLRVTRDETWSLKGIPNAYVQADGASKGYLAYVSGATLTLEDIIIDGNRYYNTTGGKVSLFRVQTPDPQEGDGEGPSVLNLKSDTVLQDSNDEAVYVYGGTLNMYDGAQITGVNQDGAIYATGMYAASTGVDHTPTVNIYGGEIVGNETRCFYLLGAAKLNIYDGLFAGNTLASGGGAVIYTTVAGVEVSIYGGTFRDNALLGTSATAVGTVFYTNQATGLTVAGGVYSGNTCAYDPGQNGFSSAGTSAGRGMAPVLKPGGERMDLSDAPFCWAGVEDAACLQIADALTGAVKVTYQTLPEAGAVVAVGAEGYRLTSGDLNRLSCTNEGVSLSLDSENNRIIVS